jgi:spore germination protein GerM
MAQRKTAPRRTAKKTPAKTRRMPVSMAFWVLFFIVLVSIFFILLPMVKKGITLPQRQTVTEQPAQQEPTPTQEQKPPPQEKSAQPKPAAEKPSAKPSAEKPPTKPETKPLEQRQPPAAQEKPPAEKPPTKPATQQPARQPTPETRDRSVYFMREGSGGDLTLAKTPRKLAVSDSPLIDCVNALLAGPSADEKNRGLTSFIPPNTRLLSARVVNNTVHLNFNEAFRYNTFGREGGEAQLRQIIWTATEFPNVNNVQIEIEGKIVDFLIEGITIRNPIGR